MSAARKIEVRAYTMRNRDVMDRGQLIDACTDAANRAHDPVVAEEMISRRTRLQAIRIAPEPEPEIKALPATFGKHDPFNRLPDGLKPIAFFLRRYRLDEPGGLGIENEVGYVDGDKQHGGIEHWLDKRHLGKAAWDVFCLAVPNTWWLGQFQMVIERGRSFADCGHRLGISKGGGTTRLKRCFESALEEAQRVV